MKSTKNYPSEYYALRNAIFRCHHSHSANFQNYGGRGITVHDEWRDGVDGFWKFLDHVGPKPSPELSLDRIDNDLGYQPGNVRWADRKTQLANRRKNLPRKVLKTELDRIKRDAAVRADYADGLSARDLCEKHGLSSPTVYRILNLGDATRAARDERNAGVIAAKKAGVPTHEVMRRFDVSRFQVWYILNNAS